QVLITGRHVVGVTTNPTIFASALAKGDRYDGQLSHLGELGASTETAIFTVTTDDVRAACDVLSPVYQQTAGTDGRVSIEVDPRLDQIGTSQAARLKGKAAIANARLAYQAYQEVIASQRWQQLAGLGAQPQRPLWASTGIKNHAYPDTMYVTELVAAGTVN